MSFFAFLLTSLIILPTALGIAVPLDSDPNRGDLLLSGETLETNQYLQNGNCVFRMQNDCNLVLYENGSPIWASQTANQATNCNLLMQFDGNLVLYDGNGNALWQSNTGTANAWNTYPCILQRDCIVAIYGAYQWSAKANN